MSALAKKIVILVTHQVEFLTTVDNILVIKILRIRLCCNDYLNEFCALLRLWKEGK